MTEVILVNPTLMAIALIGILFALYDAIETLKRRAMTGTQRRETTPWSRL